MYLDAAGLSGLGLGLRVASLGDNLRSPMIGGWEQGNSSHRGICIGGKPCRSDQLVGDLLPKQEVCPIIIHRLCWRRKRGWGGGVGVNQQVGSTYQQILDPGAWVGLVGVVVDEGFWIVVRGCNGFVEG